MVLMQTLESVKQKIAHAALRAGRTDKDITLVAVTKTHPPSVVKEAFESGITAVGENRVQEAGQKIKHLASLGMNVKWHMIGRLQKNKARQAVKYFDLIHSVDSIELLNLINQYAGKEKKVQNLLIQVKLSDEETKSGLLPEKLLELLHRAALLQSVPIKGFMTMPPFSENPEDSRPYFRKLKVIAQDLNEQGFPVHELSMGMSNDFEVAIEEGSTMVRVGTALFGKRKY